MYLPAQILLLISILLTGCFSGNQNPPLTNTDFNSGIWKEGNLRTRGQMVENLLSIKDTLLINKSKTQIISVLGSADEVTQTDLNYFFKNRSDNALDLICIFKVRFDTLEDRSIEVWWSD